MTNLIKKILDLERKLKKTPELTHQVIDITKYRPKRVYKPVKIRKKVKIRKYDEYIVSKDWYDFRDEVIKRRGKRCEICGSYDRIILHHRTYKRLGIEKQSDVVLLCDECHTYIHFKGNKKIKINTGTLKSREEKLRKIKLR